MKVDVFYILYKLIKLNRPNTDETNNVLYWRLKHGKTYILDLNKSEVTLVNVGTKQKISIDDKLMNEMKEYANKYSSTNWLKIIERIKQI